MIKADYCIIPSCRGIIKYEDGTASIQCPWCNHAFLTREFKNEQQKVFEEILSGKQAKAALELTVKEKEALQELLNKSQKVWIANTEIQQYIKDKLDVIHDDVIAVHEDTTIIKGDTKQLLQSMADKRDLARIEEYLQSIRNELLRATAPMAAPSEPEKASSAVRIEPVVIPTPATNPIPASRAVQTISPADTPMTNARYSPESDFKVETSRSKWMVTCAIKAYTGTDANVVIPKIIKGAYVTAIDKLAFDHRINLTSITLPEGIVSIGYSAFRDCSNLTSIILPNSLKSIEAFAFYYCRALRSIKLPDGVTNIGAFTFGGCSSLNSITIGKDVTSIGDNAFMDCHSLTSIILPASLTRIGNMAFVNCKSLKSIILPDGIRQIESKAFLGCTALTSAMIPYSVSKIDSMAFTNCYNLTLFVRNNSYAHQWAEKKRFHFRLY